ncbi:ATP-binding cassette domain-containing protein [Weissella confusa]|uniref:ATP-binding cassette domain-containing protein n=1 Tax=Weissella confusa TaxID=1583 RepID=A0A923ND38_WEICO|nr:ATP-binding cassette domain-containing protein [Weissella confusa]
MSDVNNMPLGLKASVGIRGANISGGQQQRLSIARILLKNADIVLYDEATSALDSKTEKIILIERLYDIDSGSIEYGDTNIKDYQLSSWRNYIGYVTQRPFLRTGTVNDNLIYGLSKPVNEKNISLSLFNHKTEDLISGFSVIKSGNLNFKNVTFSYHDAEKNVLKDVSFEAKRGEVTAIVGPSGSGKSTILSVTMLVILDIFGILSFGVYQIANKQITLGILVSSLMYIIQLVAPIAEMGQLVGETSKALGSSNELVKLEKLTVKNQKNMATFIGDATEVLDNIQLVKINSTEVFEVNQGTKNINQLYSTALKGTAYESVIVPLEKISRLTSDITTVNVFLSVTLPELIKSIILILGTVIILFTLNWQFSLVLLTSLPMFLLLVVPVVSMDNFSKGIKSDDLISVIIWVLVEILAAMISGYILAKFGQLAIQKLRISLWDRYLKYSMAFNSTWKTGHHFELYNQQTDCF